MTGTVTESQGNYETVKGFLLFTDLRGNKLSERLYFDKIITSLLCVGGIIIVSGIDTAYQGKRAYIRPEGGMPWEIEISPKALESAKPYLEGLDNSFFGLVVERLAETKELITTCVSFDKSGRELWRRRIGRGVYRALVANPGGLLFIGQREEGDGARLYVAKTDLLGNLAWEKSYGSSQAIGNCLTNTGNGNYAIGGTIWAQKKSGPAGLILLLDQQGQLLSERELKCRGGQGITSMMPTTMGFIGCSPAYEQSIVEEDLVFRKAVVFEFEG